MLIKIFSLCTHIYDETTQFSWVVFGPQAWDPGQHGRGCAEDIDHAQAVLGLLTHGPGWSGWHLSQTNLSIHNIFPSSLITLSQYQWWYPHATVNDNFPNLYAFKIHELAYLDLNCRAPEGSCHHLATVLRFDGWKSTCASSSTSGTVRYPSIFKFGPADPTRGPEASRGWTKKKAQKACDGPKPKKRATVQNGVLFFTKTAAHDRRTILKPTA